MTPFLPGGIGPPARRSVVRRYALDWPCDHDPLALHGISPTLIGEAMDKYSESLIAAWSATTWSSSSPFCARTSLAATCQGHGS
jgi:hypothetical protein